MHPGSFMGPCGLPALPKAARGPLSPAKLAPHTSRAGQDLCTDVRFPEPLIYIYFLINLFIFG